MKIGLTAKWILFTALASISACASVPEETRVHSLCQSYLLANEQIACYKKHMQDKIKQKISVGTRHLTPSDWPFEYAIRINMQLDAVGRVLAVDLLQGSTSRQLNQKLLDSIERVEQFPVPEGDFFQKGEFATIRLLIKPARKPILGAEKKVDKRLMIIYLPGPCATRSLHC